MTYLLQNRSQEKKWYSRAVALDTDMDPKDIMLNENKWPNKTEIMTQSITQSSLHQVQHQSSLKQPENRWTAQFIKIIFGQAAYKWVSGQKELSI